MHHPQYKEDDLNLQNFISESGDILHKIREIDVVEGASGRLEIPGVAFAEKGTQEMLLKGIVPVEENNTTGLQDNIVRGDFFGGGDMDSTNIVVGEALAEKLDLQLGDTLEAHLPGMRGAVIKKLFTLSGTYKTSNSTLDLRNAYVNYSTLAPLIDANGQFQEIAIYLEDHEKIDEVTADAVASAAKSWALLSLASA